MQFSCPTPEFDFETITLGHGSGGQLTNQLLEESIFRLFKNETLGKQHDGAILPMSGKMAFSTDSFVVSPIFFPGGDIGDLAMNGTMNDLAMCGAMPKYISLGLILEEGLPVVDLWRVLESIYKISKTHHVDIVTGDTKVLERGKGDKIFINTSGIGQVHEKANIDIGRIREGDQVLVSGPIATHGMTIMSVREGLEFETTLKSDTQYIGHLALSLIERFGDRIKFLRDPTRGGVATVLNEIAIKSALCIELQEKQLPVLPQAASACELLGLDPLYVANEGIFVVVADRSVAEDALKTISGFAGGKGAALIGEVTQNYPKKVIVRSGIGGKRVVSMLVGEQLPRIC